ncbi:hypothetical protein E2542_SST13700 [Spatholobus suberectus]|nr:hypothetical protein E2542_SST13700 [Spatholobus suberectus]
MRAAVGIDFHTRLCLTRHGHAFELSIRISEALFLFHLDNPTALLTTVATIASAPLDDAVRSENVQWRL